MNLLEQAEALANELRFAEYVRNKLNGVRLVHEHQRVTFDRVLQLALERLCSVCRGYGKTLSGCHCDTCDGKGAMGVAKAPAETTPAPELEESSPETPCGDCGASHVPGANSFCLK